MRLERDALQHLDLAEPFVDVVELDNGHTGGGVCHCRDVRSKSGISQAKKEGGPFRDRQSVQGRRNSRCYAAAREPSSKNSAWLISAFTMSGLNGLVTRKVGSGRSPVSNRSGNAVIKITGSASVERMSLTASMPEEPSASWISARIILGMVLP